MKKRIAILMFIFCIAIPLLYVLDVNTINVKAISSVLKMDGKWSSDYWFSKEEDAHIYKVVIPSDGYFALKIMSYIGDGCEFELYSDDLSEEYWGGGCLKGCGTGRGSENSPKTAERSTSLSKGTYILKILSHGVGRYKLWSTYTNYHVNDVDAVSYDSSMDFKMGSEVIGALTETNSVDWYRIRINKAGYYTIFWKSYVNYRGGNGATVRLYSADLLKTIFEKELYGASDSQPKTYKDDIELSLGTYYLKIDASIGLFGDWVAAGKYALNFDFLNQQNCNHEYMDKTVYPNYFNKGYDLHKCEKCGKSYKDNYTEKKKLGQGVVSLWSKSGKGKIILQWYTISGASGYTIRYCKSKKMKKGVKTITVKGQKKYKKTIKKLSRRKKYYVQVRAYKKSGNKIVYGKWSGKRKLKTK